MQTYAVRRGDTLGRIASKFYGDPARFPLIVAANHIQDPDKLRLGQRLVIPDLTTATQGVVLDTPVTPLTGTIPFQTPYAAISERRLQRLHPIVASRGRSMIELCSHAGIAILVTQGLRTWDEQDALYAKGRSAPPIGRKYIVTRAKGGQSYHNFGLAFDIVVLDSLGKTDWDATHPGWKRAAAIGKSVGLEWGGDWVSFKDSPHFQYTNGLTLAQCCSLYSSGIESIWDQVA
jgi:hypothetical protein